MVLRSELESYLAKLLQIARIKDYCPNGMQVEGTSEISKIVGGVTASQALIEKAIELKADAILVHHGYFWKGEREAIAGIKKRRIQSLLANGISLFAYHLPLDVHPEYGNNVQLAKRFNFITTGGLEPGNPQSVGLVGETSEPVTAHQLKKNIELSLGRESIMIGHDKKTINTVAWCTGAAQSMIEKAIELGVDAYISGEISEPTVHAARESGVVYIGAGHHATERYGVQALGAHLSTQFEVDFEFVDIDNPV